MLAADRVTPRSASIQAYPRNDLLRHLLQLGAEHGERRETIERGAGVFAGGRDVAGFPGDPGENLLGLEEPWIEVARFEGELARRVKLARRELVARGDEIAALEDVPLALPRSEE